MTHRCLLLDHSGEIVVELPPYEIVIAPGTAAIWINATRPQIKAFEDACGQSLYLKVYGDDARLLWFGRLQDYERQDCRLRLGATEIDTRMMPLLFAVTDVAPLGPRSRLSALAS